MSIPRRVCVCVCVCICLAISVHVYCALFIVQRKPILPKHILYKTITTKKYNRHIPF